MRRLKVADLAYFERHPIRHSCLLRAVDGVDPEHFRRPNRGMPLAIHESMARRPRFFEDGFSWHITQRGVNRSVIFKTSTDYRVFLSILRFESECHGFQVHAYTLMRNHVHLLGTPTTEKSMPKLMQALGRRYIPFFNRRYTRTGALWEGRYRPALVHDERYWLTCMRYVELNALRAGVVSDPDKHRWSSYLHHAFGAYDEVVTEHSLYLNLGATPEARQQAWREFCGNQMSQSELDAIRQGVKRGIMIGEPTSLEVG